MSISPAPAGSLIVPGLQASPVCEKIGMKPSLATTLYVAPGIASSTLPVPLMLVFVPRVTDVGDNDVMCQWVEESPQSDQLSLIVPPQQTNDYNHLERFRFNYNFKSITWKVSKKTISSKWLLRSSRKISKSKPINSELCRISHWSQPSLWVEYKWVSDWNTNWAND